MCIFCCKELKKWFKSFTRTEICLTLTEAVFLVVFITSFTLLILHFIVCASRPVTIGNATISTSVVYNTTPPISVIQQNRTHKPTTSKYFPSGLNCTWKPSERTVANTHYYEQDNDLNISQTKSTPGMVEEFPGEFDGEFADEKYNNHVLALVKLKPPRDVIFGCMVTIISEFWTVTAASCIDAIEELDSLDIFVMMENYGAERKGKTHALSDVQVHPLYQNGNRSYDLAVMKSEDSLTSGAGFPVEMPTIVDYLQITIGESFTILGFGPLRTIDKSVEGRRLHAASVYAVSGRQCRGVEESWALRGLGAGAALHAARCGRGAVCAGVLRARSVPCNYCAGTPLLSLSRADATPLLLGVMSDNQQCGISCDPQLFVNVALLRDWIDSIIGK